jgi:hypothetical protein
LSLLRQDVEGFVEAAYHGDATAAPTPEELLLRRPDIALRRFDFE